MENWLQTFGFPTAVTKDTPFGYTISSSTESLVVSILSAGTFFGALFGAPVAGEYLLFAFHLISSHTLCYQISSAVNGVLFSHA